MKALPTPTISVNVDVTNPGQFFACCGLLELADRLWPGAEGWFESSQFHVNCVGGLRELIQSLRTAPLTQLDIEDKTSTPIGVGAPFRLIRLDWWLDDRAGGKDLKVWAGTMESYRIARAMQTAIKGNDEMLTPDLFNVGLIAYDVQNLDKKVEPFYFDARRGPNSHSRDVGFSTNDLQMTTTAFPAVELLCLVGLQRCLPVPTSQRRVFDYSAWSVPMMCNLLPIAVAGALPESRGYRFENWYRTGQKKHKAFRTATPLAKRQ